MRDARRLDLDIPLVEAREVLRGVAQVELDPVVLASLSRDGAEGGVVGLHGEDAVALVPVGEVAKVVEEARVEARAARRAQDAGAGEGDVERVVVKLARGHRRVGHGPLDALEHDLGVAPPEEGDGGLEDDLHSEVVAGDRVALLDRLGHELHVADVHGGRVDGVEVRPDAGVAALPGLAGSGALDTGVARVVESVGPIRAAGVGVVRPGVRGNVPVGLDVLHQPVVHDLDVHLDGVRGLPGGGVVDKEDEVVRVPASQQGAGSLIGRRDKVGEVDLDAGVVGARDPRDRGLHPVAAVPEAAAVTLDLDPVRVVLMRLVLLGVPQAHDGNDGVALPEELDSGVEGEVDLVEVAREGHLLPDELLLDPQCVDLDLMRVHLLHQELRAPSVAGAARAHVLAHPRAGDGRHARVLLRLVDDLEAEGAHAVGGNGFLCRDAELAVRRPVASGVEARWNAAGGCEDRHVVVHRGGAGEALDHNHVVGNKWHVGTKGHGEHVLSARGGVAAVHGVVDPGGLNNLHGHRAAADGVHVLDAEGKLVVVVHHLSLRDGHVGRGVGVGRLDVDALSRLSAVGVLDREGEDVGLAALHAAGEVQDDALALVGRSVGPGGETLEALGARRKGVVIAGVVARATRQRHLAVGVNNGHGATETRDGDLGEALPRAKGDVCL
mmetsp:Transcript_6057/g.14587  ORF Transcript_6057/g.14587 Transcript_6057/m.14587 type:complete len:667 (+) Transcript_6057:4344-6344(+)